MNDAEKMRETRPRNWGAVMRAAQDHDLWRHHEDCVPVSPEGCRCGLSALRDALSTFKKEALAWSEEEG